MTAGAHEAHVLGMRARLVVGGAFLSLAVLAGCGGGASDPGSELLGAWLYSSADGASGQGVRFKPDGTYQFDVIVVTSPTTGNDQRESGTWEATGSTVTVTPLQSTCSDLSPATLGWARIGDDLKISSSKGDVLYVPLQPTTPTPAALALGCYVNGAWVPAQ